MPQNDNEPKRKLALSDIDGTLIEKNPYTIPPTEKINYPLIDYLIDNDFDIGLFSSMGTEDISQKIENSNNTARPDLVQIINERAASRGKNTNIIFVNTPADVAYGKGPGAVYTEKYMPEYNRVFAENPTHHMFESEDPVLDATHQAVYQEVQELINKTRDLSAQRYPNLLTTDKPLMLMETTKATFGDKYDSCVVLDDGIDITNDMQTLIRDENLTGSQAIHVNKKDPNYFSQTQLAQSIQQSLDKYTQEFNIRRNIENKIDKLNENDPLENVKKTFLTELKHIASFPSGDFEKKLNQMLNDPAYKDALKGATSETRKFVVEICKIKGVTPPKSSTSLLSNFFAKATPAISPIKEKFISIEQLSKIGAPININSTKEKVQLLEALHKVGIEVTLPALQGEPDGGAHVRLSDEQVKKLNDTVEKTHYISTEDARLIYAKASTLIENLDQLTNINVKPTDSKMYQALQVVLQDSNMKIDDLVFPKGADGYFIRAESAVLDKIKEVCAEQQQTAKQNLELEHDSRDEKISEIKSRA